MKEIIIEISPDGESVQVEVEGVADASCVDLTAGVERALGIGQAADRKLKPEARIPAPAGRARVRR